MRVLHVSHTASVAGAEHSLLVLLGSLPAGVEPVLAVPEGELAVAARDLGVEVRTVPGTDLSARLHPRHTPPEVARMARSARAVAAIARATRPAVVHANTPRAGLLGLAARAPLVVHVRDSPPPGRVPGLSLALLARRASMLVTTSRFLADQLPPGAPRSLVANAVVPDRFDPGRISREQARARLGLSAAGPVLAVVAQISPHKGQSDAVKALALVRERHPHARLLLVGSVRFTSAATRYDNRAYRAELEALVARLKLGDAVSFLGERADIPELLAAVDVLLVPSWYEPFGRTAAEALMMQVPVIATSVGGTREVVADGVDGLVLDPRDPPAWAAAINGLLEDPARRREMGARGRERARDTFSPSRHARTMVGVYEQVLDTAGAARGGRVRPSPVSPRGSEMQPDG